MNVKIIVFVFCVSTAVAYPTGEYPAIEENILLEEPIQNDFEVIKANNQFNLQWGGSPRQGFDVNAYIRFLILQSRNERDSLYGTVGYSQHLGGPYGNSRPNFSGGLQFTHRF